MAFLPFAAGLLAGAAAVTTVRRRLAGRTSETALVATEPPAPAAPVAAAKPARKRTVRPKAASRKAT